MAHTDQVVETLNSIPSTSAIISSSSLPEDVIISILKRLPVKSILKFKSVSKSWLSLLSTPEFVSLHLQQSSQNLKNQAFIVHIGDITHSQNLQNQACIVHIGDITDSNAMSLININSFETAKSLSIRKPYPGYPEIVNLVGSFNGLVCLSYRCLHEMVLVLVLWNPGMNLYKNLRHSDHLHPKAGEIGIMGFSSGLAYDSVFDDYKIIRIAYFRHESERLDRVWGVRAEVYSANLDSWKEVKLDVSFVVTGCNVIAKGVPYWMATIYHSSVETAKPEFGYVVWYDVHQDSFKYFPGPHVGGDNGAVAKLVNWKGGLAALVYSPSRDRNDFIDIWEYVETDKCWRRISTYGPVPVKLERDHGVLQCSKEGLILAGWELILYDLVTNHVKEFCFPNGNLFQACSYIESLVSFKEMQQVEEQDKDKLYN